MPGFGPQPIDVDPDPANFYAGVLANLPTPAGLCNVNLGDYVDNNGDILILYKRVKRADGSSTLQVSKTLDGITFTLQDPTHALSFFSYNFTGSDRYLCSDLIWTCWHHGSPASAPVALKPFRISTGLWGTTSVDGPAAGYTESALPAVLSNGNVVVIYIDSTDPFNSIPTNVRAVEYNGVIWGGTTIIDNSLGNYATINSVAVDKSDRVWILYTNDTGMYVASYFSGAATARVLVEDFSLMIGTRTPVYSGPGKYDSIRDTILFPLGFSDGSNPSGLTPNDLNLVTISTASTVPSVNIEGVASRPTLPNQNPWLCPATFFKDPTFGTYFLGILEIQQPAFLSSPLMIPHIWSRPAGGVSWTMLPDFTGVDFSTFQGGLPPAYNPVVSKLGLSSWVPGTAHPSGNYTMQWLLDTTDIKGFSPCETPPVISPEAIMLSMGESMTNVNFPHMS